MAQPALLPDDVYASLLDAIVEGRLRAGTPLSQNKLAAHLGVSRTPVREALLRLEREGLVHRLPEAGFAVATITPEEVEDACDLLALLDRYVYGRATGALSPEELGELSALAAELVTTAEAGDAGAWQVADARFHALVMEAAGNRLVAQELQQVRRRVQRFWLPDPPEEGRLVRCSLDHVALVEAMGHHDEDEVAARVTAHIDRLRANVLDRLERAAPLLPRPNPFAEARLAP